MTTMANENTETTHLLAGDTQPRYLMQPTILQQRYRRLKTFQCCMCTIFLVAMVALIVFAVSYGLSDNLETNDFNLSNKVVNNTKVLLTLTWPITDRNEVRFCMDQQNDWQDALTFGSNALLKRDVDEDTVPILDIDSPSFRHQKSFVSSNKTRTLARLGFVRETAHKYLRGNNVTLSICNTTKNGNITVCNTFQKYRSYDGTCNNLEHPFEYGVAFTSFRRALQPDYADGLSEPRTATDGGSLPSARDVSIVVHRPIYRNDNKFTVMLAVWGQFIDHDITATAISQTSQGKNIACCFENDHPDCFPVRISVNDPFYGKFNVSCMEFVRSAAAPNKNFEPRQQLNQVSSYLDASVLYSASVSTAQELREFSDGKLKVYLTEDNRPLLPVSHDPRDGCNREEQNKMGRYCFMSGDQRANENLHLTCMHLIWVRQHNFLSSKFRSINPTWTDEKIFQEVRRIIVAQLQHITYNEFLKILIGPVLRKKLELNPQRNGYYYGYDSNIDVSIANNFAAAAFRFGHTLIPSLVKFLENDTLHQEYIRFHKILFNPYSLYQPNGLDKALRGAMNTTIEASDTYFNNELKSHLFENTKSMHSKANKFCGLDLVTLNIQRGRDHGIPGYTNWRQHCGLLRPRNFSELVGDIDGDSLANIQQIYRHVDDIDLYTGAISEKPLEGGIIGPTLTCLIADQFVRLKRGDRMWYENPYEPHAFTLEQLDQIRLTTLAGIICDNSDKVDQVQLYVMQRIYDGNDYMPCIAIPRPDLTKWKDADLTRSRISNKSISVKPNNFTIS